MCEQTARAQTRHGAQQLARFAALLSFKLPLDALALPGCISASADCSIAFGEETIAVCSIVGTHPSVVGDRAGLAHRPARIAVGIMLRAFA